MELTTLLLYVIAVSAVMVTPGPSMLLALNNGAIHGMRIASYGFLGAVLADLLLIGAVGCGLGALLQASEQLFAVVKWGGALYLVYLAWVLWRAPVKALAVNASAAAATGKNGIPAFPDGWVVQSQGAVVFLRFSAAVHSARKADCHAVPDPGSGQRDHRLRDDDYLCLRRPSCDA